MAEAVWGPLAEWLHPTVGGVLMFVAALLVAAVAIAVAASRRER